MTWSYRVIEFVDPSGEPWQAIHEVYYHEDGRPRSYSESPAAVMTNDAEDNKRALEWVLDRMREALFKPILVEKDFNP